MTKAAKKKRSLKGVVKLLTMLLFLALFFWGLSQFAPNEAVKYENSFDELDLYARYNSLSYRIGKEQVNFYLYGELKSIRSELTALSSQYRDPILRSINDTFIESLDDLEAAAQAVESDQKEVSAQLLESASIKYRDADKELNYYKKALRQE